MRTDARTVDRAARDKAAELLRAFAAGDITNDVFEDDYPMRSRDRAVRAVFWRTWFYYDDLHEHRLEGKYASEEVKGELSRFALFLESDRSYEWPPHPAGGWMPFPLVLLPPLWPYLVWAHVRFRRAGDRDTWPFLTRQHFEETSRRSGRRHPQPSGDGA